MGRLSLPCVPPDVGEFEELAPGMAPAERAVERAGITVIAIEIVVAAIGIGLENALPASEMPVGVSHLPVAGEVEQCGRRGTACEGPVVTDIGPEPGCARPTLRQERHRGI